MRTNSLGELTLNVDRIDCPVCRRDGSYSLDGLLARFGADAALPDRRGPWLAESLLCVFARAKDIEALMGDFEELFAKDCETGLSRRRAVVRCWVRVLRSVGPLMRQAIRRVGVLGLLAVALKRCASARIRSASSPLALVRIDCPRCGSYRLARRN